jgi:hypothetical protein
MGFRVESGAYTQTMNSGLAADQVDHDLAGQQRSAAPIVGSAIGVRHQWHYLKQNRCDINGIEVG